MCRAEAVRLSDQDLSVADTVINEKTTEGCCVQKGWSITPMRLS
jgi:hypothetical protein